jgi:hypothetical protein
MSLKMIYFTLSHFTSSIRDFFLIKGGYASQLDYELTTENPLFEICWNSKTESFEQDVSSVRTLNDSEYIHEWVSIHSLSTEVKEYLCRTYLSHKYANFDIYLTQKNVTSTILVYVPIRKTPSSKTTCNDISSTSSCYVDWKDCSLNIPSETSYYNDWFGIHNIKTKTVSEPKLEPERQQFKFQLNPKTRNSYVLFPTCSIQEFKKKYPERFSRTGWNLFHDERVVYYSNTYNGFIVSKKYKDDLIQLDAKMI